MSFKNCIPHWQSVVLMESRETVYDDKREGNVMKTKYLILALSVVLFVAASAWAVPTQITVHVKSKDAKFIGTTMGGVLITIRNVQTGELLAKGYTAGGTGDTAKIMTTPIKRGVPISDDSAAKLTATIDIDEPTQVEVTAYGPLAGRQSANKVSATQWVIPGKNITEGDAWLMEMPGFAVNVETPNMHAMLTGAPQTVTITANVMMMCGCPITSGGLWDANKIEVSALLSRNGKRIGAMPLQYAGTANQFSGTWKVPEPGIYEATVYAYDASTGNTGLDSVTFMVAQ